jgi:hypothetical protein
MVVTLARNHLQSGYLDIHPNTTETVAVQGVCSYSPGIAGVRLARGIQLGAHEVDRRNVLIAAAEKLSATDAGDFDQIVHGRILDLICVSGSRFQYLRPLFSADGVVKESSEMRNIMEKLVGFVNKESNRKLPDSLVKSLGLFSTELIQNTQEHAVQDHVGKPYLAHIEGMMIGWTRLSHDLFSKDFSGNSVLKAYWDIESKETGAGVTSLRVFEVSYFDSGPGLVSRFKGRQVTDMTLEEERESLLECLQHKSTSKPGGAAGEGLPLVLNELKQVGGLIRIRSGRLSVFNAFTKKDPHRNIFDFENWSDALLAPVEGAVVSILVPLRAE